MDTNTAARIGHTLTMAAAATVPVHQRPTSCHVCGSAAVGAGRPSCSHDYTNAEAFAQAAEHDRRTTVTYSSGARNAEANYVETTRGR